MLTFKEVCVHVCIILLCEQPCLMVPTSCLQIISSDLHNPHGLAVDWISNNIYFSHSRGEGHGRIEVAKCDGSHRKVLRHNLQSVGVLAVNPLTGYVTPLVSS